MADTNGFSPILQDSNMETKVMDKLFQRSEARIIELEKKKADKENKLTTKEQTDYFNVAFNQYKKELNNKLLTIQGTDKCMLNTQLDQIIKDYQKLQKLLSDSTMFLPTYDIKVAQNSLKNLQEDINKVESALLPKKKFAFRSKGRVQKLVTSEVADNVDSSVCGISELSDCDIYNLSEQTIEKYGPDINKKDVGLHSLRDCKIYLYGNPSTMFISKLTKCEVYCGPVSASILIENCIDCTFISACQQLRVHSSTNCTFHLHVTSRTIIEDCTSLRFAPYSWSYPVQDMDFTNSGLNKDINNWDQIDDFNWLVSGVPSPNWSVINKDATTS